MDSIRGRHTELVSVYVPSGFNLQETVGLLRQEYSLASNVKDKTVRKNVMAALERVTQHLRLFKQTPPNGLVVFSGNISENPGEADIELWSMEPPEKITTKIYRCDQVFILDPLKAMVSEKEVYGLIVLDAKEATIGLLKGKSVQSLKNMQSVVPSKTVKGGMSQHRYDRLREDAIHDFLKDVGELATKLLLHIEEMKGLIIGGPGPVKEKFAKEDYLNYMLKNKMLGVKDVSYTDEYGLQELVNRSADLMADAAIVKEQELMKKFFEALQKDGDVVYGFYETIKALESGSLKTLYISEDFDWMHVKLSCQCGFKTEKDLPPGKIDEQTCENCQQVLKIDERNDLIELLTEKAKAIGTDVELISTQSKEGAQFKELGGIGGFLRFKVS